MEYIKIYGAPRSGTNNIRYLLNENFESKTFMDLLGFRQWGHPVNVDWSGKDWSIQQRKSRKHKIIKGLLQEVDEGLKSAYKNNNIKYVVIVRHPCSTYLSRLRKRYKGKDFTEAVNQPVGVFWFTLYWNGAYWNWHQQVLKQMPSNSILIKHEDVVYRFEETMKKIQNKFNLNAIHKKFIKTEKKLHPSGLDSMSTPLLEKTNYDLSYDNRENVYKILGKRVKDEFKAYVDDELMEILGYSL